MKITEISLEKHAQIYETMRNRKEQRTESEVFYIGEGERGEQIVLFQNGYSDHATLIQLDVAA